MKVFIGKIVITPSLQLHLTEEEARALEAIAGYGTDSFLEVFYKHMGSHYLKPYEKGLRSLFESIKNNLCPELYRLDTINKMLDEINKSQKGD